MNEKDILNATTTKQDGVLKSKNRIYFIWIRGHRGEVNRNSRLYPGVLQHTTSFHSK